MERMAIYCTKGYLLCVYLPNNARHPTFLNGIHQGAGRQFMHQRYFPTQDRQLVQNCCLILSDRFYCGICGDNPVVSQEYVMIEEVVVKRLLIAITSQVKTFVN